MRILRGDLHDILCGGYVANNISATARALGMGGGGVVLICKYLQVLEYGFVHKGGKLVKTRVNGLRLYCYVDETGPDTKGRYFLVAVIITEKQQRDALEEQMERIERESKKGKRKWIRTHPQRKFAYLEGLLDVDLLRESILYASYQNRTDYVQLTTLTIAQAILHKAEDNYQAIIYIHRLNRADRKRISVGLGQQNIRKKKVRGLRETSSALIRLADAMAGFLRDCEEGEAYTKDLFRRFLNQRFVIKLE